MRRNTYNSRILRWVRIIAVIFAVVIIIEFIPFFLPVITVSTPEGIHTETNTENLITELDDFFSQPAESFAKRFSENPLVLVDELLATLRMGIALGFVFGLPIAGLRLYFARKKERTVGRKKEATRYMCEDGFELTDFKDTLVRVEKRN